MNALYDLVSPKSALPVLLTIIGIGLIILTIIILFPKLNKTEDKHGKAK